MHLREISRLTKLDVQLVAYHIKIMKKEGRIFEVRVNRQKHFFSTDVKYLPPSDTDRNIIISLRSRTLLPVVMELMIDGTLHLSDLASKMKLKDNSVHYRLQRLIELGVVSRKQDRSYFLTDRERTKYLLVKYRPTRDIISEFIDLWSRIY